MKCCSTIFALTLVSATGAAALDLSLPAGAESLYATAPLVADYALPVDVWSGSDIATRLFEGKVSRRSWRFAATDLTPLQLIQPLRDNLTGQDYDIVLDCAAPECGGFDFRFATEVLPAPHMFVDTGNYRFLSAVKDNETAASFLVSRAGGAVYLQIINVEAANAATAPETTPVRPLPRPDAVPQGIAQSNIPAALEAEGHVVLGDLEFATGSAQLEDKPYRSLEQIAAFLTENVEYRLALVGHTDSVGTLEENVALSERRAAAVRERLVAEHGLEGTRLQSTGVGYLAPVASNLAPEGRQKNRRVEAVLLP